MVTVKYELPIVGVVGSKKVRIFLSLGTQLGHDLVPGPFHNFINFSSFLIGFTNLPQCRPRQTATHPTQGGINRYSTSKWGGTKGIFPLKGFELICKDYESIGQNQGIGIWWSYYNNHILRMILEYVTFHKSALDFIVSLVHIFTREWHRLSPPTFHQSFPVNDEVEASNFCQWPNYVTYF